MPLFKTQFDVNRFNSHERVTVRFSQYASGGVAILLDCDDGSPYANATININDDVRTPLATNEVAIKDYSEGEGMADLMIENGIINAQVIKSADIGHVLVNIYQLSQSSLDLIAGKVTKKFKF